MDSESERSFNGLESNGNPHRYLAWLLNTKRKKILTKTCKRIIDMVQKDNKKKYRRDVVSEDDDDDHDNDMLRDEPFKTIFQKPFCFGIIGNCTVYGHVRILSNEQESTCFVEVFSKNGGTYVAHDMVAIEMLPQTTKTSVDWVGLTSGCCGDEFGLDISSEVVSISFNEKEQADRFKQVLEMISKKVSDPENNPPQFDGDDPCDLVFQGKFMFALTEQHMVHGAIRIWLNKGKSEAFIQLVSKTGQVALSQRMSSLRLLPAQTPCSVDWEAGRTGSKGTVVHQEENHLENYKSFIGINNN